AKSKLWVVSALLSLVLISGVIIAVQIRRAGRLPAPLPMQTIRPGNFGNVLDATISPDGNMIAFVRRNAGRYSLKIRQLDSNSETQLIPESEALCWGLRFSYDGSQVYYLITEKNSTISVLYRLDVQGGVPAKLTVNIDTPIALSPDGVRFAFCRRYPTQRKDALIVADADGASEREIAVRQHPETFALTSAAWSPDGKLIALGATTSSEGSFKLVGVSVDDGQVKELTPEEWTGTRGFAWARNGKSLFFIAGKHDTSGLEVWRLAYPGGAVVRLTNDPVNYEEISLTRDGKTMVAMQVSRPSNLWTTSLADESSQQLLRGDGKELAGVQMLSGNRLAYTLIDKGLSNIWTADADGSNPKQLTSAGAAHPAASPNGEYLVFAGLQEKARHLWRLNLKDSELQQLTYGAGEDFPSFSPDGKWIVYTSLSADRYTLWRAPLTGGEPTQLTKEGLATQPSVSPDGRLIACAYRTDSTTPWKIALLPVTGGTPIKTLGIPYAINQIIRWSPDSKSLLYLDSPKGVSNVWRLPLSGDKAEALTQFSAESIFGYQFSGDGKQLISARGTITRQVIIFTNPG
ncbi:MAG TPA: LpqB family beta-propeller domain-containing protein, partial [Pyrinomonadaceae bacterium]|nr:LpqB family beta-propeller domain-containing protein [Pyrinomonadaceae bacterium]